MNYRVDRGAYKFSNYSTALSFARQCHKLMMIVLGDNEKFWVVTPDYVAGLKQ